ncbi:MAG: Xanthine/uracil/thiamine/ascorbate permease family protein [Gammaproteobacteria bacterium]|jgi:AGZA family xanthine/uracil permease-like MFS transporter|nr:Xanthine/uracil/thiamine/ascorbate permease family protein [Gammaproteobacteria bacterium]
MQFFKFEKYQSNFKTEIIAGLTTFFTMAYIVVIAPSMLSQTGMNYGSAFVATCLVSAFASFLAGTFSNLPIALAPGLGLLSYFSYVVVGQLGYSWQAALGAVLISGLVFFLITVTKLRQYILAAIPRSLGCSIAAGVGFFIGFIALKNVGLIVQNTHTLITLGPINNAEIALFFLGFFIIATLDAHKVPGSIIIGMILVSLLGRLFHVSEFNHFFALPPSMKDSFLAFDVHSLFNWASLPIIFTFIIVALFDSTGTLIGLSFHLDRPEEDLKLSINRALLAESIATTASSMIGLSTVCPFVESASGIKAGGRTGFTAWVVAGLFLLAIFLSPLAASVPVFASSAALFYVACIMVKPFAQVNWEDVAEYIPAVITLLSIPLTFSIADGVGLGVICYVTLKTAMGNYRDVHPVMWLLSLVFIGYFSI